MTISSASRRSTVYTSDGTTKTFSFAFKMFGVPADVRVDVMSVAGAVSTLAYPAAYSVSFNADQNANPGGSITLGTAQESGAKIRVLDATAATQTVDLNFADGFPPDAVENAIDRAVAVAGRAIETAERGLLVPQFESGIILPSAAERASKYVTFAADGLSVVPAAAPAGTTAVSVFAATMLDDTTAEAVRRTILVQQNSRLISAASGSITAADYGRHVMVNQTCALAINADTLIDGWWCDITNTGGLGSSVVTLDPDAAATIGIHVGATAFRLYAGETVRLRYDGDSVYRTLGLSQHVLLNDVSFSGVSFQPFTYGVNSTDFDEIEVQFQELGTSTTTGVYIQISTDGGSTWVASGYQHARSGGASAGTNFAAGSTSDTAVALTTSAATTNLISGYFAAFGSQLRHITGKAGFSNSYSSLSFDGFSSAGSPANGLRLTPGTGTLTGSAVVRGKRGKF